MSATPARAARRAPWDTMGRLRTKMEQDLRSANSAQTGEAYLRAVAGLARYYQRAPDTLAVAEVGA